MLCVQVAPPLLTEAIVGILASFKNRTVKIGWNEKKRILRLVWQLRFYPNRFIRLYLGIRLAPHQRLIIAAARNTPRLIIQASRGMSKTFIENLIGIMLCSLYKGYKVQSTAGGSFKQTEQTFDYMESTINNEVLGQVEKHYIDKLLPKHGKPITKQPSNWVSKIGSSVMRGLAIKGGNRGFRGNTLMLGEANDIERESMDKVLRPFLNVLYDPMGNKKREDKFICPKMQDKRKRKNFLMFSGTISYDFTYYFSLIKEYTTRMMNGDPEYKVCWFDFEDSYIGVQSIDPNVKPVIHKVLYGMDLNEILAPLSEDNISYESWLAEQKNIPIATEGKFYPPILIYDSYKKRDGTDAMICPKFKSDKLCVMGIDPFYGSAKGQKTQNKNAEFALSIIELDKDVAKLVHCFGIRNIDYSAATAIICEYLEKFPNIVMINMDARGGGVPIRDNLRSASYVKIPIIDPTDPDNAYLIDPFNEKYVNTPFRDILRLVSPTDEFNTIHNESLKNMLQQKSLIIPYTAHGQFDYDRDNRIPEYSEHTEAEIEELYKGIHVMKKQITSVETEMTSNYLKFFVRSGCKDRYSSFVYAAAALRQYRLEHMGSAPPPPPAPCGAWS